LTGLHALRAPHDSDEGGFAMRRLILWIVVIVFVVSVFGPLIRGFGVKAAQPQLDAAALMKKKLTHAQKLLEGIALADLSKIGDNARELSVVSKEVGFRVLKTPQYELHANEFRRALDDIQRGVAQKNLDAATLGYMDLTMSCVRCHKHVREVGIGLRD
jgi:hypothetical protein